MLSPKSSDIRRRPGGKTDSDCPLHLMGGSFDGSPAEIDVYGALRPDTAYWTHSGYASRSKQALRRM